MKDEFIDRLEELIGYGMLAPSMHHAEITAAVKNGNQDVLEQIAADLADAKFRWESGVTLDFENRQFYPPKITPDDGTRWILFNGDRVSEDAWLRLCRDRSVTIVQKRGEYLVFRNGERLSISDWTT